MENVTILRVESYQADLADKIVKLLEPLGGLDSFCKYGERVLLKPNLLMPKTPESAALTHPEVILALARLLLDQGCRVAIGDSPGMGSAEAVLRNLEIAEKLSELGVEIVEFEKILPWKHFTNAPVLERRFKNLELAGELIDYDRVINLPKLKSHGQMGITLATKNLFGCVVGHAKGRWHFVAGRDVHAFARILVEIALTVNPTFNILDGIVGMDGNGPSNGRPRELGILMASANPLALDRVVVELIGKNPDGFPIFAAARELGVIGVELDQIDLKGGTVAEFQIADFQIPALVELDRFANSLFSKAYRRLIRQRLVIDYQTCINCRKCEAHCPAKAISFRKRVRIREANCIKCCCCQEFCPVGAIALKDVWTAKLLRKITMRIS